MITIGEGLELKISTIEGSFIASLNDYIVKGVNGKFYMCNSDLFESTYNKQENPLDLGNNIENNFSYHESGCDKIIKYGLIRRYAKDLAYCIKNNVPDGREKSLAMTKLEECSMWANAGIARNNLEV